MSHYHCRKCHHERDGTKTSVKKEKCNWCGADKPIILEEFTPLEKNA